MLFVTNCGVSDISALESLQNLEVLSISSNPVNNLSIIQKLQSLRRLYANDVLISDDIGSFMKSKTLETLQLQSNNLVIPVVSPKDFPKLKRLDLSQNQIESLLGLRNLRKLESICLYFYESESAKLEWLFLKNNKYLKSFYTNDGIFGDLNHLIFRHFMFLQQISESLRCNY